MCDSLHDLALSQVVYIVARRATLVGARRMAEARHAIDLNGPSLGGVYLLDRMTDPHGEGR